MHKFRQSQKCGKGSDLLNIDTQLHEMQFAKKAFSPYLTFETCSEWEDVHPNRVLAPRVKFPKNKGGSEVIFTFYKRD